MALINDSFLDWVASEDGRICLTTPDTAEFMMARLSRAYHAGMEKNALQPTLEWYQKRLTEREEIIKTLKKELSEKTKITSA
jgi:hypothetical protein